MIQTRVRPIALAGLCAAFTACGLLDVTDPTALEEHELANASGAELLRRDVMRRLFLATAEGALAGGLLSDEFMTDPPVSSVQAGVMTAEEMLDRRESHAFEQHLNGTPTTGVYVRWQETRTAATNAIARYRAYADDPVLKEHLGELFALRALVTLRLAEDFCPGFPLHDVVDYKPAYGGPRSTDQAFAAALADLDSAFVYAADSVRILNLAAITRARALLGLGRIDEAGSEVTAVATDFELNAEFASSSSLLWNPLFFPLFGTRSVADREGGVGLDYVTGGDPRVATTLVGTANDGVTGRFAADKYADTGAPIVLVSGLEARLIEAEAALAAGDTRWLSILNEVRASQILPPLEPLSDPGTDAGRIDILFRERAFWLFGTGRRLADLRRLVWHYGRPADTVFPAGPYRVGGEYGNGTSIPFPAGLEASFNSAVTGCTSR